MGKVWERCGDSVRKVWELCCQVRRCVEVPCNGGDTVGTAGVLRHLAALHPFPCCLVLACSIKDLQVNYSSFDSKRTPSSVFPLPHR